MTVDDAKKFGLSDGQVVSVKLGGERAVIFAETVLRVSDKFATRMHIDTDEANAAALQGDTEGEILD